MSNAASDFLENKVLDHVLRYSAAPYTAPSTLYVGLFTASTGLETNSPSAEVSGNGYARKTVTFATASGGSSASNATVTFDAATGTWGTISHVAIMDSLTTGNVLFWGQVTTSKTIESGDTFQISSGNLTISLS
jgi:hypothetical protein